MDQLVFWKQFLELSWAEPIFLILFCQLFFRQMEFLPLDLPGKKRDNSPALLSANKIFAALPSVFGAWVFSHIVLLANIFLAALPSVLMHWDALGTFWDALGMLWDHLGTLWDDLGTL